MIQQFITAVGQWITGMIGWLGSAFTGITELFYDDTEGFTFLGLLMLLGLGVGLIYFAINFIRGLIQK